VQARRNVPKLYATSEQSLQNAIIDYLRYRNFWVMRINSGAVRTERGGMVKMGIAGTPDILAIKPPTQTSPIEVYWVEVKLPGKHSTDIQKMRQDELRAAGCKVYEIHSLDEMQQIA
jgi:hypothetical protein